LVAVLGFACAATLRASASEAVWRQYKVRRTFVAEKGERNPFGKSDVLAADFLTTGFAEPDGSDIRAFAGDRGRPVDCRVMLTGPGDRARVAIRMLPGESTYHVCYGGPKAPQTAWEPEVGLLLETRKFNGGNVRNPAQMRDLVRKSKPSFGTWFVPNVFHGLNPFGPSDGYVSVYSGLLYVAKAGRYRFATTSDDASYLLVDGQVLASKRRWGRGPADARFRGAAVDLKAGAHKFEYYHVEGTHYQFAVAAWQPPGGRFQVIPPSAFPGVFRARPVGLRISAFAVPIDLSHRADGEVIYEGHHLYKVRFRDATPDKASRGWSPKWFFGDGTSSDERTPEHVYFVPGERQVTFALVRGGRAVRIRQKIVVGQDWEHPGQRKRDTAERYYQLVKDYDFSDMDSASCAAAMEFFAELGKDAEIMKAAAPLVSRDDEVARKHAYRSAVLLGERLRDVRKMPDEALVVFRAAVKRTQDRAEQAKLFRRAGDTLLYALRKSDEALTEYQRVLNNYADLKDNVVRLAQLRVGDAYRTKGEYDKALVAYKKAATMKTYQRPYTVQRVRRGAMAQSIEGYLARRQFDQAQQLLDLWGWEHPTDRIAGEWSLMAAKVARAKGEKESALRDAVECAKANPRSPYADRLLLLAAELHVELGRGDEAVELSKRIQKEYPESAWQQQAALVECRGLYEAKQRQDAARKAAVYYGKYATGEGAEAFLMVAANAALSANDAARARELLRAIVRQHPETETAKRAAAKLEALKDR
jgi:outer membrane protein assembly factor BamD (BamD/ComL family)